MSRLMTRLSLMGSLFVAVLFAIACGGIGIKPTVPQGGPTGKPDFTLTSKEYVKESEDNTNAAVDKYKNKVVELTGKVMALSYDGEGKPQIYLEGSKPAPGGLWVSCLMVDKYPWAKVNSGQTLTAKGKAHAAFPRMLVDCEIVTVTGDPAPRMTADEFAKRADDPNGKKDGKSQFVVSGEIDDKPDKVNITSIHLKTQNKKGVQIHFQPQDHKRLNVASWKPGQKIEVIGTDSSNPGHAWLVDCLPMSDPK